MTQPPDFGGMDVKAGQPQIYVGTEDAPGNGKRLLFVQTHGRVPLNITVSRQDHETMLKDGGADNHPEEWCDSTECGCFQAGVERASEPPPCRADR